MQIHLLAGVFSVALLQLHAQRASAQDVPAAQDLLELDTVVVTGTRVSNRTISDSSAPIDVFAADDLLESGYLELGQSLQRLAPSFNLPQATIGATANVRAATLRGLAPDQTLVLINGKRRHASSLVNTNNAVGRGSIATDLALIPMAAIERVEVLRDGASAQYGSDAIAGVINVILRSDSDGTQVGLRGRKTERADGLGGQASLLRGFELGNGGSLTLSVEAASSDRTNNALTNFNGTPQTNPNYGKVTAWFGDPETDSVLLSLNMVRPFGDALELYGFATGARREVFAPGFFRDLAGAGGPAPAPDNGLVHPNGYLPLGTTEQTDFETYVGVRGELGDAWRWDLSTGVGRNQTDQTLHNSVNVSFGAASPTEFDTGGFEYLQWKTELELGRSFALLAGADLTIGVGHRYEEFSIRPGEPASRYEAGSDPLRGLDPATPIDESRSAASIFVDGELSITDRLRVGAAARYEDYSSFGDTVTGRFSTHFKAAEWLSLRGSVSTGFRAPSLQQAFYTTVNRRTNTATALLQVVGTYPVDSPAARAVGALPLEPEESRQLAAGFALKPLRGLLITVDYFDTRIKDRISLSEQLSGPAVIAALAASGIRNVTAISFFTNAIDTTTEGFEVATTYQHTDFIGGDLELTAAFSQFETQIDRVRSNSAVPSLPLLGARSLTLLTESQPETKASFGASFSRGPATLSLLATHYGGYTVSFGDQIPIGEELVVDCNAAFDLSSALRLTIGVQNAFDEYPDVLAEHAPTQGARLRSFGWHYPEESPFGNNGRTYIVQLTASF